MPSHTISHCPEFLQIEELLPAVSEAGDDFPRFLGDVLREVVTEEPVHRDEGTGLQVLELTPGDPMGEARGHKLVPEGANGQVSRQDLEGQGPGI